METRRGTPPGPDRSAESPSSRMRRLAVAASLGDAPRVLADLAAATRGLPSPRSRAVEPPAPKIELSESQRSGVFTLSGFTLGAGQLVVGSVTFPQRIDHAPGPEQISLQLDEIRNVPEGGVAVMRDGGFAPSREGFALAVASAEPGVVRVSGRWSLLAVENLVPKG